MSSNAFAATLDLVLRPSPRALKWLFAAHGAAIALTMLAQPPKWAALGLAFAFVLSWMRLRRHSVFGYGPRALTRLIAHAQGDSWTVEDGRGRRVEAWLLAGSFVHPLLIVLNFRLADGTRHARALLGDETNPEQLRRLRARLLNTPPAAKKQAA